MNELIAGAWALRYVLLGLAVIVLGAAVLEARLYARR